MKQLTPVTRDRHANKKWQRIKDFGFASKVTTVPVAGIELVQAAMAMPLAFVEKSGRYSLIAMLSVLPDRNMLVSPQRQWMGAHVPMVFRAYPFRMVERLEVSKVILCVDEDGGLLPEGSSDGEEFFDPDGNLSPALKAMGEYLKPLEGNLLATDQSVSMLDEAGVIQPWNLTVKTDAGFDQPVEGLHVINEAALNALKDDVFLGLRETCALPIAYAQLFSMKALSIFEHLAKLHPAQANTTMPDSVQKMFSKAADETVRFN